MDQYQSQIKKQPLCSKDIFGLLHLMLILKHSREKTIKRVTSSHLSDTETHIFPVNSKAQKNSDTFFTRCPFEMWVTRNPEADAD